METFDQALKYLAQKNPADFIGYALGEEGVRVLKPLPSGLPARGRDVDGCYLAQVKDEELVVHLEFHRRNQSLAELGMDVTEAQVRIFRREKKLVTSLVWDLYGRRDEPSLERREFSFGRAFQGKGSLGVYLRVNLRALSWREFLRHAPAVLWPLVALTRDGAQREAIVAARDAINAQKQLGFSERADYLAILRFVADAEDVPKHVLDAELLEELLMGGQYYESVVAKGIAKGEQLGIVKGEKLGIVKGEKLGIVKGEKLMLARNITWILERRLGSIEDDVRRRITTESELETLEGWYQLAADAVDAKAARKVVQKIRQSRTKPPQP